MSSFCLLPEELSGRIEPEPNSGCWLWAGCSNNRGYGTLTWGGKSTVAHRVIFALLRGEAELLSSETLDHLCRVRLCVNPWHLEPVTMRENILRGESVSAIAARQVACVNGHHFTHVDGEGYRRCLICVRAKTRRSIAQMKERLGPTAWSAYRRIHG